MVLYLEDDREFKMFHIPQEIVLIVNKLQGKEEYEQVLGFDRRESIYDVLYDVMSFSTNIKDSIKNVINRIIIDDVIREYGVYVATVEFKFDGIIIEKKLIPSHAVALALLFDRPIFIRRKLVDEQEKEENKEGEGT